MRDLSIPCRSGPTVAEAFIKEGKAAGKASKKRKAPRGYAYVDDAGDDVDLMPPPPAPGKVRYVCFSSRIFGSRLAAHGVGHLTFFALGVMRLCCLGRVT